MVRVFVYSSMMCLTYPHSDSHTCTLLHKSKTECAFLHEGVVWEAGLALAAQMLCDHTPNIVDVRGKRVVELGSGTGLVSQNPGLMQDYSKLKLHSCTRLR